MWSLYGCDYQLSWCSCDQHICSNIQSLWSLLKGSHKLLCFVYDSQRIKMVSKYTFLRSLACARWAVTRQCWTTLASPLWDKMFHCCESWACMHRPSSKAVLDEKGTNRIIGTMGYGRIKLWGKRQAENNLWQNT